MAGERINAEQLQQALAQNTKLFIAESAGQLLACIGLTFAADHVEIGTFCIAPHDQNQGIGKHVRFR